MRLVKKLLNCLGIATPRVPYVDLFDFNWEVIRLYMERDEHIKARVLHKSNPIKDTLADEDKLEAFIHSLKQDHALKKLFIRDLLINVKDWPGESVSVEDNLIQLAMAPKSILIKTMNQILKEIR